jgi:hypothetical protein
MHDDLHEAVRAIYRDTAKLLRDTTEAFNRAVDVVRAGKVLSLEEARREVARMLAVEPVNPVG